MGTQGTFCYRGGKSQLAEFILAQCQPADIFVDAFGGSGAMSVAAVRDGRFKQVLYNDKDSCIYNTLITVRDKCDELVEYLSQTPIGRNTMNEIYALKNSGDPIKEAAGCIIQLEFTSYTPTLHNNPANGWARPFSKGASSVSRGWKSWAARMDAIRMMQRDLLKIFLENGDWHRFVKGYVSFQNNIIRDGIKPHTIIFLDPPYGETRGYNEDVDTAEVYAFFLEKHEHVTKILCDVEGVDALEGEEFIAFPNRQTARKTRKFEHGIYINSGCQKRAVNTLF